MTQYWLVGPESGLVGASGAHVIPNTGRERERELRRSTLHAMFGTRHPSIQETGRKAALEHGHHGTASVINPKSSFLQTTCFVRLKIP